MSHIPDHTSRNSAAEDRYQTLARWASGGMADVFLAKMIGGGGFNKVLALKVLREENQDPTDVRQMFLDEAKTTALLSHPNIVQTFDAGEINGRMYMAMEFVHGETLGSLARRVWHRELFPIPLAVEITRVVAEALHHAHTLTDLEGRPLTLIHRDISPQNIMLTYQGVVKLLDFGIAKVANAASRTKVGIIKGKLQYMPPEQARSERVGPSTDIFALGLVLWELITGRPARDPEQPPMNAWQTAQTQPPPPSFYRVDCDRELDRIIGRATAVDRSARYESAEELAEDLARYVAYNAVHFSLHTSIVEFMNKYFAGRSKRVTDALRNASSRIAATPSEMSVVSPGLLQEPSLVQQIASQNSIEEMTTRTVSVVDLRPPTERRARRVSAFVVAGAVALLLGTQAFSAGGSEQAQGASRPMAIESIPSGANVLMDGQRIGKTPMMADVPSSGSVSITIERPGYMAVHRRLGVQRDSDGVRVELQKANIFGTVMVRSDPPGATIRVDEVEHPQKTPAEISKLWIGEPHRIVVSYPGHVPWIEDVAFTGEQMRELTAELSATEKAFIQADCRPACELVIDGELAGEVSDAPLPVAAGKLLAVELRHQGETKLRKSVSLSRGEIETLRWHSPSASENGHSVARAKRKQTGREDAHIQQTGALARATRSPDDRRDWTLQVRVGSPRVDGVADRGRLRTLIKNMKPQVLDCYADAHREQPFEGKVKARFVIDADGQADKLRISGRAAHPVSACLEKAFARVRFPSQMHSDSVIRVRMRLRAR